MNTQERLMMMLEQTANALGPDLVAKSAFVGGCVVGLLLTDDYTKEQVRATDDVDLIIDVLNHAAYFHLAEQLRQRGFRESPEDDIQCRWRLRELIVDVMPTDERILGFTNRWYKNAIDSAVRYELSNDQSIRVVSPPYFVATKIEAFNGRGKGDFLESRDIEDIITLVDGRDELANEIMQVGGALRSYIARYFTEFLNAKDFDYAVESAVRSDSERAQVVIERFTSMSKE